MCFEGSSLWCGYSDLIVPIWKNRIDQDGEQDSCKIAGGKKQGCDERRTDDGAVEYGWVCVWWNFDDHCKPSSCETQSQL